MNKKQRLALIAGIAVIGLTALVPPWQFRGRGEGYHLIFLAPKGLGIDLSRLLVEWVIVGAIVGGLMLFLHDKNERQTSPTDNDQPK